MKVISLLVLASTASAFVPGSAPIRTWCVGFCINITPRVGWKEWCDMQSPIEMMGYWKDGRHFEQIAIAIENIYIIWGSYLICVWFCKRGEIMRNLIILFSFFHNLHSQTTFTPFPPNMIWNNNQYVTKSIRSVSLDAKHVNNKAAKKANHDRPRKSRPSDINRKPTNYPQWNDAEDGPMPTEYTISGN